jgi:hypothetical protein
MRIVIFAALAAAAVSMAGCGKKEEKGLQVTSGGQTVTVGEDGVKVAAKGEQAGAPDFAPIYPGAKVESIVTGIGQAGGATSGGMASLSVSATPQQVIDFYRTSAANAGLKAGMDMGSGGGASFSASDEATKRMVQVIVSPAGDKSNVQLIWAVPNA